MRGGGGGRVRCPSRLAVARLRRGTGPWWHLSLGPCIAPDLVSYKDGGRQLLRKPASATGKVLVGGFSVSEGQENY